MTPKPQCPKLARQRFAAMAVVAAATLTVAACSSSARAPGIAASVASYDLVAGRVGRFQLGLGGANGEQLVAFGSVPFRFQFLGPTGHLLPKPIPGPTATADYDPIPGQHLTPGAKGPRLVEPSDGIGVYRATGLTFATPGTWEVTATVTLAGEATTVTAPFEVLASSPIPNVGDPAPATENPLPGGSTPLKAIDSRASDTKPVPDPELHATTVAAALAAHLPMVVVVSTPTYCQSRFCGPITDSVARLVPIHPNGAFIHLEVWQDFEKNLVNPAAGEWINPNGSADAREPWVFVIGRDGRIKYRFDNIAGEDELAAAVDETFR